MLNILTTNLTFIWIFIAVDDMCVGWVLSQPPGLAAFSSGL